MANTYKIKNGANLALSEAERDALTPLEGDVIFNTDTNKLEIYNGTNWIEL